MEEEEEEAAAEAVGRGAMLGAMPLLEQLSFAICRMLVDLVKARDETGERERRK